MNFNLILNLITVLEIIMAEFVAIWMLSKRKHSFVLSFGLYAAITAALLLFMCLVAVHVPGYGNGSGRFMILGVCYFIPALINYGGDWKSRMIIAFYSFSYGLAGFALSVRIGYLFPNRHLALSVCIIQSLLYLVTLPVFLRFSREKVVPYIEKSNNRQKYIWLRYTIVSFLLIIAYNRTMTEKRSELMKMLVYLLLVYFIILSYRLLVSYLKADDDNQELSHLAMNDRLTGLGNRMVFRKKAEHYIAEGQPFCLMFMDLNHFKSINDEYGHNAGDWYLRSFAGELRKLSGEGCECFRFGGDEFVCLSTEAHVKTELEQINLSLDNQIPFLGVAVGMAKFPEHGTVLDELLEKADKQMYLQKQRRRGGR